MQLGLLLIELAVVRRRGRDCRRVHLALLLVLRAWLHHGHRIIVVGLRSEDLLFFLGGRVPTEYCASWLVVDGTKSVSLCLRWGTSLVAVRRGSVPSFVVVGPHRLSQV